MKNTILLLAPILFTLIPSCRRHDEQPGKTAPEKHRKEGQHSMPSENDSHDQNATGNRQQSRWAMNRSTELRQALAKPTPGWLHIGVPEQARSVKNTGTKTRSPRGECNIAGKQIIISPDLALDLSQDRFKPRWASLSPDGKQLLVTQNQTPRLFAISENGFREVTPAFLPNLNYGDKRRWFVSRWVWLNNSDLAAAMNEEDATGDQISRSVLYRYSLNTHTMTEILIPDGFINPDDPHLEIVAVSESGNLRIQSGTKQIDIEMGPLN